MPELPEVETVRRDVDAVLVGRRIEHVVLGRLRSVRRYADPSVFVDALRGRMVTGTGRHGKYLLVHLGPAGAPAGAFPTLGHELSPGEQRRPDIGGGQEHGDAAVLVVHLRMSGQLLHGASDAPLRAHTHVRLGLDDGTELRFVDPRTFGELFVTEPTLPELASLGPDALDPAVDGAALRLAARGRTVALKAFLLDQSVLAGVGSIYADEICFRAGLRPGRSVARITGPQFARVHGHVVDVLSEAIEARGSTLGDGQYVGLDGRPGTFAARHRVHAKHGQPCGVCGTLIRRGVIAQRSAHWCPSCQR